MKLDIVNNQWLEIVFDGRNKLYGAYQLRKSLTKNSFRALLFGAFLFSLAVSMPLIMSLIPNSKEEEGLIIVTLNNAQNIPKKQEKPKENLPPPPPPPPAVDQVKFVKPVVAKAEEVVEEIAVVKEIEDKKIGSENIKGNDEVELTVEPVGKGDPNSAVVEEDNTIYNSAGIEVSAQYPGGVDKFRECVNKNFDVNRLDVEEGFSGRIFISFVIEKDGSLTDIKSVRDVGYGTGNEAVRAVKTCSKVRWDSGEQNGKKVRQSFSLPISVQSGE